MHTITRRGEVLPAPRPATLTCLDCGLVFDRDPSARSGYRPRAAPSDQARNLGA